MPDASVTDAVVSQLALSLPVAAAIYAGLKATIKAILDAVTRHAAAVEALAAAKQAANVEADKFRASQGALLGRALDMFEKMTGGEPPEGFEPWRKH